MSKKKIAYNRNSGFKIPDNYFQDFEARLMGAINEKPVQAEPIKKDPGFVVPGDYFTSLEDQIFTKLEQPKDEGKVISLFRTRKFYYAAAVAAVFLGLISTLLFNPITPEYEFSIDSVELSALESYIDEGYIDLNFDEISAYLTDEGYSMRELNVSDLTDEEVFNYLSETVEDPNDLLE